MSPKTDRCDYVEKEKSEGKDVDLTVPKRFFASLSAAIEACDNGTAYHLSSLI